MIDLNPLKEIDGHYGHLAVDPTLRLATIILQQDLPAYDLLGRWGGEEFRMVLPGAAEPEAPALADRIRDELGRTLRHQPKAFQAGFGFAALPWGESEIRFHGLVPVANLALHQPNRRGRNPAYPNAPDLAETIEQTSPHSR